jgi:maltose/moltooligosaccharide transporter
MNKTEKPLLKFYQIFNMSVGFLGIQFGFALQNGNASRILQNFGAEVGDLSLFWLAAPLTGLFVQPIVGYYSDRTWNRLGRRKPYLLAGGIMACLALFLLPNSSLFLLPSLMIGLGMLIVMDVGFNMALEPSRALVADNLPDRQRSIGFSMQTFMIGIGAVGGSWMPYLLSEKFGVQKVATHGHIPNNVLYSFYVGGGIMISSLLYTMLTTKEYPPKILPIMNMDKEPRGSCLFWIFKDISKTPKIMLQIGLVQFFSWFALFSMKVFMAPAVAVHIYHLHKADTYSAKYADSGNWIGICFGIYNGVSAIYALFLPSIVKMSSRKAVHAFSLTIGGISLISIFFVQNPIMLVIPMIGIGLAWASVLTMPYAILSSYIPQNKIGVFLGIFNVFITIPQIINGFLGSWAIKNVFYGKAIYTIVFAGIAMLCAAIATLNLKKDKMTN